MGFFSSFSRMVLSRIDAETAHKLAVTGLKIGRHSGLTYGIKNNKYLQLKVSVAGLDFPNPLGVAAGFDKNGEVFSELIKLGFGYVEVGTVTPHPQNGNPQPRVFRLVRDKAIINRLGFNNKGHKQVLNNLQTGRQFGITGVNIGANRDSVDFIHDYELGIRAFWDIASYFTINISSPNTPGLRHLQAKKPLEELLKRVTGVCNELADEIQVKTPPLFLKIAPDLSESEMDEISQCVLSSSIDGLVISNTTVARDGLLSTVSEEGGLSGYPLFDRATIVLAKIRQRVGKKLPIIGVGGIDNGKSAWEKLEAGANLLQLYTGMVYQGPGLANSICRELACRLKASGYTDIMSVSGTKTREWSQRPLSTG